LPPFGDLIWTLGIRESIVLCWGRSISGAGWWLLTFTHNPCGKISSLKTYSLGSGEMTTSSYTITRKISSQNLLQDQEKRLCKPYLRICPAQNLYRLGAPIFPL
jgi:hypothetical protein